MNLRFPWFILLFIVCVVSIFPVIGTQTDTTDTGGYQPEFMQDNNTPIIVGILVMKSGFVSDIGTEYSRAFNLSQQDNPDSLIQPVIRDAGSNASTASSAWKNLTDAVPDLPVVITVASWTTNVVYPDASKSGTIQIALGSAMVNRSTSSDRLIRFTPGVEQESPVLASCLKQFNKIMLIGGNNDYTNGYDAAFKKLLPEKTLFLRYYNPDDLESTLNTSEIQQTNPDVLVLLSFSEGAKVVKLIRNAGIRSPLMGTRGIESSALAETKEAEGIIFTTPALNRSHPFFSRYEEKYGTNATFFGAEGFDAMNSLNSAEAECGNSQDCIYSWYQNREFNGTLGSVRFDERGVATYPITFNVLRDGKFENLPTCLWNRTSDQDTV